MKALKGLIYSDDLTALSSSRALYWMVYASMVTFWVRQLVVAAGGEKVLIPATLVASYMTVMGYILGKKVFGGKTFEDVPEPDDKPSTEGGQTGGAWRGLLFESGSDCVSLGRASLWLNLGFMMAFWGRQYFDQSVEIVHPDSLTQSFYVTIVYNFGKKMIPAVKSKIDNIGAKPAQGGAT